MKKRASFLVFLLLIGVIACGIFTSAESDAPKRTFPQIGITISLPDSWDKAINETNRLVFEEYEGEMYSYYRPDWVKEGLDQFYSNLPSDSSSITEAENEALNAQFDKLVNGVIPIAFISTRSDAAEVYADMPMFTSIEDLGEMNGTRYTLLINEKYDTSALTEEEKAEFEVVATELSGIIPRIELIGMNQPTASPAIGAVAFSTTDLSGNTIDSSILSEYDLTMINIWATWCGPCVGEIPDLAKLHQSLPAGVNLIGICTDADENGDLARSILSESGAVYANLVTNADMLRGVLSSVQAFPTTIFVDKNGNPVGDPVVGAPSGDVAETYLKEINARLDALALDGETK